jgi:cyclase
MACIDLSLPVRSTAPGVSFEQWPHEDGARRVSLNTRFLPGMSRASKIANYVRWLTGKRRIKPDHLPGGVFLSNEFYRMSVHQGTHVDAPFHYGPTCEGKPAKRIADLPLEWFWGRGVVLDVRDAGDAITTEVISKAIRNAHHTPGAGEIVLLRTDADLHYGTPGYVRNFPGVTPESIDALLDLGVKVIGTDGWGFDRPVPVMIEEFYRHRDPHVLWPAHFHGREREYIQIEGLANLRSIPYGTFWFAGFPIHLAEAGGAWCRAVAITEDPFDQPASNRSIEQKAR